MLFSCAFASSFPGAERPTALKTMFSSSLSFCRFAGVPASRRGLKVAACAMSNKPMGKPRGIKRPRKVSPAMQELIGVPEISRTESLKLIYAKIKQNNLQALSIVSVSLLAVEKSSDLSPIFFTGVMEAIVAALLMNIYIVGLNQLSDIEIDKVNKPYLPLASGEYSVGTGVFVVTSFAMLSFWLSSIVGSWPLFGALFISFILGTAYSINGNEEKEEDTKSSRWVWTLSKQARRSSATSLALAGGGTAGVRGLNSALQWATQTLSTS